MTTSSQLVHKEIKCRLSFRVHKIYVQIFRTKIRLNFSEEAGYTKREYVSNVISATQITVSIYGFK